MAVSQKREDRGVEKWSVRDLEQKINQDANLYPPSSIAEQALLDFPVRVEKTREALGEKNDP